MTENLTGHPVPYRSLHDKINFLPDWARQYIHDLETRADPAGEVRTIAWQADTILALERHIAEMCHEIVILRETLAGIKRINKMHMEAINHWG
jgi:hypothetical protein